MTYAALMVHVHADPFCEPRLRLAAGLADDLDAMLIGIGAEHYSPPPDFMADERAVAKIDAEIREELQQAEALFRTACAQVKRGVEWRSFAQPPAAAIARQSRAADLVICAGGRRAIGNFVEREASAADLLMTTGRPVLCGPAHVDHLDLSKIVLAWKDTRETRRAMADAMPLLCRAQDVLVVAVPEGAPDEDADIALTDVVGAIRRRGGRASSAVLPKRRSTAEAIEAAAAEFGAELIVAGGYGHSRLREWAFGGVTNSLLQQKERFVLLSR